MRFTAAASAILAFAVSALAQTADFNPIYKPESGSTVEAGSTVEITWEAPAKYASGTVSIHLIGGATQNTQEKIADIASGVDNSANSYSWTVDASLGDKAVYGLVFTWEADTSIFQYSNPFHIAASTDKPTASVTASASDSGATTITTDVGAVTITISSCTTSTTPIVTPEPITSHPVVTASQPQYNSTISVVKPVVPTTLSSVEVVLPPAPTAVPSPSPSAPVSGAAGLSASLALVGGIAMAIFAL